jgi:hypothetical protein
MDCFKNLVGVANVCGNSTSGLYLNDLPGISVENADASIDSEYYSGVQLLNRKIEFAQNAVINFVRSQTSTKLKSKSLINSSIVGVYKNGFNPIANYEQGIRIKMTNYNHLELFVSTITSNLQYTGDFDVNVYDLITGNLIDTFSGTSSIGEYTTIQVNKSYPVYKQNLDIAFVIDASLGESQKTDLRPNFCSDCHSSWNNGYATISGISIQNGANKTINNTNGLSLLYSIACSIEPFICSMGNLLSWAILHKAGAEVLKEMKISNRLNNIVLLNRDNFDELINAYENEYMSNLSGVMNSLQLPNDACFDCNRSINKVLNIP